MLDLTGILTTQWKQFTGPITLKLSPVTPGGAPIYYKTSDAERTKPLGELSDLAQTLNGETTLSVPASQSLWLRANGNNQVNWSSS